MTVDISVIIPTYNRSAELAKTLEGMVAAEKDNLSVGFVIVDNGSTDSTKSVVESFSNSLSIQYIFEKTPGKSHALNTALEKAELAKIIVFTDDDIDASKEWLVSIASTCERWPVHKVFGGKINIRFPIENVPKWATDPYISSIAFSLHSYCNNECIYEVPHLPFGPNFWVKKEIFKTKRRFNETIGPFPDGMILGEDTLFLRSLFNEGYRIVYSPSAAVTHRVRHDLLKLSKVYLRAYQLGRGETHILGTSSLAQIREKWPRLSKYQSALRFCIYGSILKQFFRVIFSFIYFNKCNRVFNVVKNMRNLGSRVEAFRLLSQIFQ